MSQENLVNFVMASAVGESVSKPNLALTVQLKVYWTQDERFEKGRILVFEEHVREIIENDDGIAECHFTDDNWMPLSACFLTADQAKRNFLARLYAQTILLDESSDTE